MAPQDINSPVDLNRTLPKLPVQLCLDLPPNLSLKPTTNLDTYNPKYTPAMSQSSPNNTKQHFQNMTRELLLSSSPEASSSTRSFSDPLDPVKYSPQSSSMQDLRSIRNTQSSKGTNMSSSCYSDQSSRGRSPIFDQGEFTHTLMEEFYERRCDTPAKIDHNGKELLTSDFYRPKGMTQSRSEGNMFHRAPPPRINTRFEPVLRETRNYPVAIGPDKSPPRRSPTRGRSVLRAASPAKLDDIAENQITNSPSSPIKRSRSPVKQLFGERGWLGRSTSMKELPSEEYRKTGFKHWGEKLKQKVGEISHKTGEVSKLLPTTFAHHEASSKSPPKSKFPISLDPPAQSKLYAEVELMISATANQYLMTQAQEGRMSVESLQKVTQSWMAKNRPQVVEFQFDQLTQHELVQANLRTFRFYGAHAENVITLNTMMISWRTMAKEMSVRTFCTPDSVIRKQLHDCYKVLEMLGAPVVTFLAFQEIQVRALATMRDQQRRREQYASMKFGMERKWEPDEEAMSGDLENPFG